MKSKPTAVDVWCAGLAVVHEAAQETVKTHKEQDVILAFRILDEAMLIAGLYDLGKEVLRIEVGEHEPQCVACGADTTERGGHLLYCSDECRALSGIIRYIRGLIQKGKPIDVEQLSGIGRNVFHWVSTGEPYTRRVPQSVRIAVFERDGHMCQVCGKEATDIDHIDGSSTDVENLQALCSECNRQKMLASLVPVTDEQQREDMRWRIGRIAKLVASPVAPALGFDPEGWDEKRKELTLYRKAKLRVARVRRTRASSVNTG